MNNKGFAITGILYGVLVLFLMVTLSLIGILNEKRERLEKLSETVNKTDLNVNFDIEKGYNSVLSEGCFNFNSDTLTIESYESSCPKEVDIPSNLQVGDDEYIVREIKAEAFASLELTSVIIPDTITSIGDKAFYGNSLTSVTIKEKSSVNDFDSYGTDVFGWASGYSDSDIIWK